MGRPRKATTDPKEAAHLELVRNASVARNRAVARLRAAHADEWEQFYAEEAAKVGVTPRVQQYKKKREELMAELARLDALEAKARGRKAPAPTTTTARTTNVRKTATASRGKRNGR